MTMIFKKMKLKRSPLVELSWKHLLCGQPQCPVALCFTILLKEDG